MKILTRYLALTAIAVILGSCSFAIGALNHKKSRVVASAIWHPRSTTTSTRTVRSVTTARSLSPYVAKSRSLPARPRSAPVRSSRSVAPIASKDISASTDIDYITYTITNLNPSSGEPDIQDYLDPYYPYIDVFLTPGNNYRITVDVVLLASSPLAANTVGITGYGDSAFIAVPADGSDVWVDMSIHAEGTLFKNLVTGGNAIGYVDPATGGTGSGSITAATVPSAQDKFFYTSDSLLYYFNYASKKVFQWTNITTLLSTATPAIDGTNTATSGLANIVQIYAICPDPAYAGWFYVAGFDTVALTWNLWVVNYDPAGVLGPTAAVWYLVGDITADLQAGGLPSPTVAVTGITADTYGFAYVTFYNYLPASSPVSGVAEFDSYSGGPAIASFIPPTSTSWTSGNSIFTDAMYNGSNIYVLASPNTSVAQALNYSVGTADVYILDTYLSQLSSNPSPVAQSFNGTVTLTGGGGLILPNKFTGTPQGGTFFLSQTDFVAGGTEFLSAVPLDLSSVRSVP